MSRMTDLMNGLISLQRIIKNGFQLNSCVIFKLG